MGGSLPFATPSYVQHTFAAVGFFAPTLMFVSVAVSPQFVLMPTPVPPDDKQICGAMSASELT